MKPALVLIGPGRVGCAISHLLQKAGYPISAVIGRDQSRTEAAIRFIGCDTKVATTDLGAASQGDILLLGLPDDQLAEFATHLADVTKLSLNATLIHFSGLHPAKVLEPQQKGSGLLSIHPLLPFADRELALDNLKQCPCAIEGDQDRLVLGEELVRAFGGDPFFLPSAAKQSYHAAACIASNFMVSLTACARDLLTDCGLDPKQAMHLLAPIHRATSANILALGPEQALTGPIVRGDSGTVAIHLKELESKSAELADLYRCLARETLKLALNSKRLEETKALEIQELLKR